MTEAASALEVEQAKKKEQDEGDKGDEGMISEGTGPRISGESEANPSLLAGEPSGKQAAEPQAVQERRPDTASKDVCEANADEDSFFQCIHFS